MIRVPQIVNIYCVVKRFWVLVELQNVGLVLDVDSIVFLLVELGSGIHGPRWFASWFLGICSHWCINFNLILLDCLVVEETINARACENWGSILKSWSLMPFVLLFRLGPHHLPRVNLKLLLFFLHQPFLSSQRRPPRWTLRLRILRSSSRSWSTTTSFRQIPLPGPTHSILRRVLFVASPLRALVFDTPLRRAVSFDPPSFSWVRPRRKFWFRCVHLWWKVVKWSSWYNRHLPNVNRDNVTTTFVKSILVDLVRWKCGQWHILLLQSWIRNGSQRA